MSVGTIDLPTEAGLLTLARRHRVSVPEVVRVLAPEHGLGSGYIMSRERGEALPFRILGDERFAAARIPLLANAGTVAELATGEGKTLVATLPAVLAGLMLAAVISAIACRIRCSIGASISKSTEKK